MKDILFVFPSGFNEVISVRILDTMGKKVRDEYVVWNHNDPFSLDVRDLPDGVYFVNVNDATMIKSLRFIKVGEAR